MCRRGTFYCKIQLFSYSWRTAGRRNPSFREKEVRMQFDINAALPAMQATAPGSLQGLFMRRAFEAGRENQEVWEGTLRILRVNNTSLESLTTIELIHAISLGSGEDASTWLHLLTEPFRRQSPPAKAYRTYHVAADVLAGVFRAAQTLDDTATDVIADFTSILELLVDSQEYERIASIYKNARVTICDVIDICDYLHIDSVRRALGQYPADTLRLWRLSASPSIATVVREAENYITKCPDALRPMREKQLAAMLQRAEAVKSRLLNPRPSLLAAAVLEKVAFTLVGNQDIIPAAISAVDNRYAKPVQK